jgi:UDP-N-acetylmuramate--alanine ligase
MSQHTGLPEPPAHVHFVGIGGIGMSGLARILAAWEYRVTGSDAFPSNLVEQLRAEGIDVQIGHDETANSMMADLIVATAAVRPTNPEIHAAKERGTSVIKRAELLGMLANSRTCVAVAGSHGKSTTSGMLVTALHSVEQDPSYAVGAVVASTGTNAAPGSGEAMVVEADEYDYSFLWLKPAYAIITNIDYDHPDLFPDQSTYDRAFVRFAQGMRPDGTLVVNGDDPGVQRVIDRFRSMPARVLTYGAGSGNDWRFDGRAVTGPSGAEIKLDLAVPGVHNRSNATAALVVMREMGIELPDAASALSSYRGVGRRFELKGEADGVTVIDDYAHHPQEIAATIAAARERYPGRRIVAAFQPHTYSRTRALLDPFAQALGAADRAIVLDIYPARETETLGVSSEDIVRRMDPERTVAGGTLAQAVDRLFRETRTGDVVLTLGAGDVTLVGPKLLALLEDRS